MNNVFLADFAYPCVAYVIRRLGIEIDTEDLLMCHGEKYTPATVFDVGDIIIWERSDGPNVSDATLTIGEFGPVTTKLYLGRHFGVYEGHGLVSDTTFDGDTYSPRIRLMRLSDRSAPKEFLQLHNLQNLRNKECPPTPK